MINLEEDDCEIHNNLTEKENYYFHDFSFIIEEDGYNKLKFPFSDELLINMDNNPNKNYFKSSLINSFSSINSFEDFNSLFGKTKVTTINYFSNKTINNCNINGNLLFDEEKKEIKILKKRGRKGKKVKVQNNAEHDKFTDDNVIRKIKTAIFQYILIKLNKSLENKHYKFLPLNAELNKNLKRDLNVELLNKRIYEIYMSEDLNGHHINNNDSNKNLIKKIFEENIEIKTINILNMKFSDILKHIRENDLQNFLKLIKDKEEKKKEKSFDKYINTVIQYLNEYEDWFKNTKGRNTDKRIKK